MIPFYYAFNLTTIYNLLQQHKLCKCIITYQYTICNKQQTSVCCHPTYWKVSKLEDNILKRIVSKLTYMKF